MSEEVVQGSQSPFMTEEVKEILEVYTRGDNGAPLFNDDVITGQDTNHLRKKEQPHHRIMVLLRAQGYTTREIARQLGYSDAAVSTALRQPWARAELVRLITSTGMEGVEKLLKAEMVPSILRLVDVRDSADAKGSEVIAACNSLIDRFLGKPVQRVETSKAPETDVEALQAELESLKAEEGRLKQN